MPANSNWNPPTGKENIGQHNFKNPSSEVNRDNSTTFPMPGTSKAPQGAQNIADTLGSTTRTKFGNDN